MRESLYTQVISWVNTIFNLIDISTILPRYEGPYMIHTHTHTNGIEKQNPQISILYCYKKNVLSSL